MTEMDPQEYAERVANNTASMITEVTQFPDGTPRRMTDTMAAAVLTTQSNLAIAAALILVAHEIKESRS